MSEATKFSIVVPVFNEEKVLPETYRRLHEVMEGLNEPYEIIFVNDGSSDRTMFILDNICEQDRHIRIIDFAKNFGHQTAITAGMDYADGDAVVVIDADLQDPPELIPQMIDRWREGYDVVYGKRKERKGETLFKRFSAALFYRLMRKMTDVDIPVDTGDFRLIDRRVCDALKSIKERNRYIRGIISWLGFRQIGVEFSREERFAGETKYPMKKMLKFAFDAITSFSFKPLKLSSYLGMSLSFFSFVYLMVVVYQKFFTDRTVAGWASSMVISLFFNGIVLMMLGIAGEYIGRIYDETKGRPLYVVRRVRNFAVEKDCRGR
ncbi:undecaprenyl-phosphate glycosyltransferase, DPM1-like family [Geotalea daltonii FRC-32]|uniref:Undecaprenyl-phosphate glycosyltransferase, DPM1-like family n=1 Tax=Geotalea daltonii (strain DSM 22248 / JCM 15807 / FRC-32) TaxID=316067 RepID=B9M9D0_GEODF|nr:glycosyltransferase family 2 protein [Geotalea daltonii]ACM18688.1 undecaprenyl-phosphate glycosyltransferase, DPM1-like family [Geotalea daltonii FRC-32]